MLCPICHADLPDHARVCPVCGADPYQPIEEAWDAPWDGQLSSDPDLLTSAQGTKDQVAAPPVPSPQHGTGEAAGGGQGRAIFGAGQGEISTRLASPDPLQDRATRIVDVSIPAVVRKAVRSDGAKGGRRGAHAVDPEIGTGIEDLYDSVRLFYARMHRVDRATLWVAVVTLVGAFCPWSSSLEEGLLAGIQEYGAISGAGALVVLAGLYARTVRRRLAGLFLSLQVLCSGLLTAAPVYRFFLAGEVEFKFGLFLTALGGAALIVLTLIRLAARNF